MQSVEYGLVNLVAMIPSIATQLTKNYRIACNHGSSRCRPWATNAHAATSGPSANAAATPREPSAATRWPPSLALVARSLAPGAAQQLAGDLSSGCPARERWR